MQEVVHLAYFDDAYIKIKADPGIVQEIADHLTFYAENYKWDKRL